MRLNKFLSDGTLLGRTSRRFLWCWLLFFIHCCFCDVVCCCFYVSGLHFPCHWHSTLASQACECLHLLWALPWLLSIALLFRHIFTASATVLSGYFFLPTGVFCLTLLPHIFATNLLSSRPPPLGVSSSLTFAGLHADPRNTGPAHLFVWFTVICNLDIQKNSH